MRWYSFLPIVGAWAVLLGAAELLTAVRRRTGERLAAKLRTGDVSPVLGAPDKPRERESQSLHLGELYTVMARGRVITGTLRAVQQSHCGAQFYFEWQTPFGLQVFTVCECKLQAVARPMVRGRIADIDRLTTAN